MKAIDIARKLAALEQAEDACRAYTLAIHENSGQDPALDMEAALYILEHEGDYKISYTCFRNLYNQGHFREDVLAVMTEAFYAPNEADLRERYARNCDLLKKYPYCFREDFVPFEDLPIRFYPYDDDGYLPFFPAEERFGDYINFENPVVSRNFFQDLEKPVLAEDVYSQYELEYLCDNVRRSEYVGRENHVYLHYTSWAVFCAHLQCLNMGPLLREKKPVFLAEEEISQYPIDFKERFGIDYSKYPLKAVGIREIKKMIWHTQLSTHNGGDFFNEVFDSHPNLLFYSSLLFSNVEEVTESVENSLHQVKNQRDLRNIFCVWPYRLAKQLHEMKNRTAKDILVALYLRDKDKNPLLDERSRIVPALFFQPHFENLKYDLRVDKETQAAILVSDDYEALRNSPILQEFKYIKTFTPMRRFTTSYGAAVKFMDMQAKEESEDGKKRVFDDGLFNRVLNRSFMLNGQDRLYKDSVLVRFEDGKLNPRATFTALAAFLDIPYTESLTYCSNGEERDPESYDGNVRGFDPAAIYKKYDEYANDSERYFLEFFLRDAYEYYGYDFQYYDGAPVDQEKLMDLIDHFTTVNSFIRRTWMKLVRETVTSVENLDLDGTKEISPEEQEKREAYIQFETERIVEGYVEKIVANRRENAKILLRGLRFVNPQGQPLRMMPKLKLDPALLEQPLYH